MQVADGTHTTDGLWRWLLGGLVAGGIMLGLLIAAYAIGYHRGQHHSTTTSTKAAPTTPAAPAPSTAAPAPKPFPTATVPTTPALLAKGKQLYTADGCSACHSLDGSRGAGPTWKGLAGSQVELANGQTVTADDTFLIDKIAYPKRVTVAGNPAGLMATAIASFDLVGRPNDVRALVAFIKAQK